MGRRLTWPERTPGRVAVVGGAVLAVVLAGQAIVPWRAVATVAPPPPPDITKLAYQPVGHFKPGDLVPLANEFNQKIRPLMPAGSRRFNPSGTYNAFDTNVFEVLGLPYRAAGDVNGQDPYGNGGDPRHGFCAVDPQWDPEERPGQLAGVAGKCPNHQLEYSAYFAETMRDILGDFGVTIRKYRFENPGGENTQSGVALNTAAIVPGAERPEETVIVSGHFDQTNDGPASAWDSAEGHAQVIRVAKLMADYWRARGTRPAVTVKFVPWDAEESGTLGSADYVANNVVPGQSDKVRGYFNTDPCAGGYPAFRFGNPLDRVDLGIQLANPDRLDDPLTFETENPPEEARARIAAFNAMAPRMVEQVFDHLDDTVNVAGTPREVFVSSSEAQPLLKPSDIGNDVIVGDSRPIAFSSDWKNFEDVGIPFFNPGPEVTGPSSQAEPGNPDGLAILHTPNDNIVTLNKYTGDATGLRFSEGWIKGMEMCAHLLAWFMLQPQMAGEIVATNRMDAYYEALPNEASVGSPVRFDGDGSATFFKPSLAKAPKRDGLQYAWDFGDGTTGTGRRVEHTYARAGTFPSRLTVTDDDGSTDTMTIPIVVTADRPRLLPAPQLTAPATDADGTFTLSGEPIGGGPTAYEVSEAGPPTVTLSEDAEDAITERWTPAPTGSARLAPWQRSDGAPTLNKFHSPGTSFWTGPLPPVAHLSGNRQSVLTLDRPVLVPATGTPELSYWTLFRNEPDEQGIVEAAVDDGDPATEPQWVQVDSMSGGFPTTSALEVVEAPLAERTADLSPFAGKQVLLRFRFVLGGSEYFVSESAGWYVDDIRVLSRAWSDLGSTAERTVRVSGRGAGEHTYRVRGVYETGERTASSTTAVRVTGS